MIFHLLVKKKKKLIMNYKNKKKSRKYRKDINNSDEDYDLKDIINLNNQIKTAIKYIYNLKKDKKEYMNYY
jgi:hypothetical protein